MYPDQAAWEKSDQGQYARLQINLLCMENVKQEALLIFHIRKNLETSCLIQIKRK